jgi:hypothetical protein
MVLQDLIDFLSTRDQSKVVPLGFANPHSYRGSYDELAFEPRRDVTVGEMLQSAKEALGKVYQGYKGGDYEMSEFTECNLANYGCCGEAMGPVLLGYMVGEHALAAENKFDHQACDTEIDVAAREIDPRTSVQAALVEMVKRGFRAGINAAEVES